MAIQTNTHTENGPDLIDNWEDMDKHLQNPLGLQFLVRKTVHIKESQVTMKFS